MAKVPCFHSTTFLVVCLCCYMVSHVMTELYILPVMTSIEKEFGLSSSEAGMLLSIKEMCVVVFTAILSHLLSKTHRPRVLAVSGVGVASGGFLYAIAYFTFRRPRTLVIKNSTYSTVELFSAVELCSPSNITNNSYSFAKEKCSEENEATHSNSNAYYLLVCGSALIGICMCILNPLSTTYIDDAVPKNKSPLILGIVNGMKPLGPVLAFLLGGIFTKLPSDLNASGISENDPRWSSAWYLGFLVAPGCLVATSLWLGCFPERKADGAAEDKEKLNRRGLLIFTHLLKSLLRVISNPAYLTIVFAGALNSYIISGMLPFIPKYMEKQFYMTTAAANLFTGVMGAFVAGVGVVIGGAIITRWRLSLPAIASMNLVTAAVDAVILGAMAFVACPQLPVHGLFSPACNNSCSSCHTEYQPVCDGAGVTFISACHAGCATDLGNNTLGDCSCLQPNATVTLGLCPGACWFQQLYLVLLVFGALFGMIGQIPAVTIILRTVPDGDRGLAIALATTIVAFITYIPGPVIYGAIIDTTCNLWLTPFCSKKGACAIYDNISFRWKLHGITALLVALACIIYAVNLRLLVARAKRAGGADRENINEVDVISPLNRDEKQETEVAL